jgi:GDPmannose 4,6-dehydratase
MKVGLITGVTGQDGSHLAELLLSKGYEVHGLVRQSTQFTPERWGHLRTAMQSSSFHVHHGDVTDATGMRTLIDEVQPDEVYNLAAQSHVGQSFEQPINTVNVTAMGPLNLLEAIRRSGSKARFYEASSSEMFGKVLETPQSERTPFYPRSPYGCAKVFGHYITQNYREAYGIHASSGILFNHEGPRRGENFVTRKITLAAGRIKLGLQKELMLGPLDVCRDWGYAPDYVEAMWLMLQQDKPDDYVIGTGQHHSVQEFVDAAFGYVGLDPKEYVRSDPKLIRPSEVNTLRADASKAKKVLGWKPTVTFHELVKLMVEHDMRLAEKERLRSEG